MWSYLEIAAILRLSAAPVGAVAEDSAEYHEELLAETPLEKHLGQIPPTQLVAHPPQDHQRDAIGRVWQAED